MFSCQCLPQAQARDKISNKLEKLETDHHHHVEAWILTGGVLELLQCYQEVQASRMLSVMSQQEMCFCERVCS